MPFFLAAYSLLVACGGESDHQSLTPPIEVNSDSSIVKKEIQKSAKDRTGEEVYQQVCQSCHLVTGEGITGAYPPLAGSEWLAKENSVLIRIVLHGLMGEIQVRGRKYNNVMAAWGTQLNDIEIANVLSYIRSSWGNTLPPITSEEVAKVRKEYEGHGLWKPTELE